MFPLLVHRQLIKSKGLKQDKKKSNKDADTPANSKFSAHIFAEGIGLLQNRTHAEKIFQNDQLTARIIFLVLCRLGET